MKLIDFSDIKKIDFSNIEEKQKDIIIANIIYYLLKGKISEEELKLFPNDINNKIQIVLNKETKNDQYYKIVKYLDKILVKEAVDLGEGYSIENFIKKDDFDPVFEYKCEYSKPLGKVALGLIFPEDSFFCDVPEGNNHAVVITEYFRRKDPDYENLAFYQFAHEGGSWHKKVMDETNAIIIHFIPDYCEASAFFIPKNITEYQYNQLIYINNLLKQKGLKAETNIDSKSLDELLNDEQYKKEHVKNKEEILKELNDRLKKIKEELIEQKLDLEKNNMRKVV